MSSFRSRRGYRPSFETLETRDCPAVTAPTGLQLVALSPTQVKVTWTDVANENGYRVYQWNGTQAVQIASLARNTTTFTANQLTPNQLQYFTVQAFDATTTGTTAWGSVRTLPNALTAPSNLRTGNATATQMSLAWNDASGETGYRIFMWNGTTSVQVGTVGANVLSYQVGNLTSGTVYYFYVQSYNATNAASSDWVSGTTTATTMTSPTGLTAQLIGNDKIQLNWRDAAGELGYRVYRWDASTGNPVAIATLAANTTSYQSTGLQFGTQYWYYVQAYNNTSTVANSTWVNATTPSNVLLTAPANFQVTKAASDAALLSWTDSAGAQGYRIYYWVGNTWAVLMSVQPGTQQVRINNLLPNRTHWFLVQSFTINNTQIANTSAMFVNL